MTLEDLAFDLGDLRELKRTHEIKRQKHLHSLRKNASGRQRMLL